MLTVVFNILTPLFLIAAVGYVFGLRVKPNMQMTNRLVMDVFMPALIFHVMIQDDFNPGQTIGLVFAGVLLMLGSGLVAYLFARFVGFSWRPFVAPTMFSNWANLGLPLYVFALGEHTLGAGLMLVVAGNILCFSLGVYIYSGKMSLAAMFKVPILIAVLLGGVVSALGLSLPEAITTPIDMLGKVAIPLMLFSLGVRLTRISRGNLKQGVLMAVFCPIVGVGLALILIQVVPLLVPLSVVHQNILILFGVLPPAVINFMLAEQYDCEPEAVASMVLIANIGALVSLPLVLFFVLSSAL